jgi:hypothetical protein
MSCRAAGLTPHHAGSSCTTVKAAVFTLVNRGLSKDEEVETCEAEALPFLWQQEATHVRDTFVQWSNHHRVHSDVRTR